ncbi:MAG TPA: hypothetical protein VIY26_10025 [Acidimicrobiales bacterium]
MSRRSAEWFPGRWQLLLVGAGVTFGVAPFLGARPTGASTAAPTTAASYRPGSNEDSAATTTALTLEQWKQRYEHDIGILADDVLVVVDDGKRAQNHTTTAKVRTTLRDCRTWASDAGQARTAAPPIPLAVAERAWTNMIGASSTAASDCLSALQHGSRHAANDFRKQLQTVENDEAALTRDLDAS